MKRYNVLVFPSDSEIGLEIWNSLRWSVHVNLFGGSSFANNHSKYVYKNFISTIPYVDKKNFIPKLNKVIKKYSIDLIFPAHDAVVLKLAQHQKQLKAKVVGSPVLACEIARSKKKTYEYFRKYIPVPKEYAVNDKLHFPLFLKPDVGNASRGIYVAHSRSEIDFYLRNDPTLLILEYLPGKEYTIDCFTDRFGKLRYVGPRERMRILGGISVSSKTIENKRFNKMADVINNLLPFRGMWFFQVKEDKNGKLALMEIAPRVAGTMGLTRNRGINLPLLSVYDSAELDVDFMQNAYVPQVDRSLVSRYVYEKPYKTVYLDADDTLIKDKKINSWLMLFIFQCINKNKKIVLLTKHKGDLKLLLAQLKLERAFTEIFHINMEDEKAKYIKDKSSIFIDDSFAERRKVAQTHGIPTFDVSALESLIDWRE